jgi:hypothetical protein
MKDSKSPNEAADAAKFTKQLLFVMYRKNGTPKCENGSPAGLSALQASLVRGKEMVK